MYGFLGCGNMGGAIARALSKATKEILVTDRSGKAKALAEELGICYASAEEIVSRCDRIFLAVKPHMMADLLRPWQDILQRKKPLLISMAAGLTIAQIEQMARCALPIIRIMPNTPVAVGEGMTLYSRGELVSEAMLQSFLTDMRYSGRMDALEESLMDAAGTLSGCTPAYMYMFIEALADGGVACGLPRAKATEYAAAAMVGAAKMVLETGKHPGELKDAVCSPGGSTIQGVRTLEQRGFRGAAMDCVISAFEKTRQLGAGK